MSDDGHLWNWLEEFRRHALAERGLPRRYARGETVFVRGDPGDYLLVVRSGLLEVSVTSLGGRKSVLNHAGPGEILGEISVLDRGPRSADVTALDDTDVTIVPRAALVALIAEDRELALMVIERLCALVRNASEMFETHALTAASARLARCLVHLARKWGSPGPDGGIAMSQRFSQAELGAFAGLARENVNRYLRAWAGDGLITFDRGEIAIHDMDALERLAEL